MHRGNVSTTCRPASQCLQPNIIKHNASIALSRPNSTQGWNCLFIISIILGLWKMALTICCKIEEVIFLSKCILMMCCLMECLRPAFQNAGYSALFLCFISVRGGSDKWRILFWRGLAWGHLSPMICKGSAMKSVPADKPFVQRREENKVSECSFKVPANDLDHVFATRKRRVLIECYLFLQLSFWKGGGINNIDYSNTPEYKDTFHL